MSQNHNTDSFELDFKRFEPRPFDIGNNHRQASLAPSASESSNYDLDGGSKGLGKGGGTDGLVSVHLVDPSTSSVANSKTMLDWDRDRYDEGLLRSSSPDSPPSPVEYRLYKRRWVGVIALVSVVLDSGPIFRHFLADL
jgi:hypothetical protein